MYSVSYQTSGLANEKEKEIHSKTGRMPNDIDAIQTDRQLFTFYECEPKIWVVLVRVHTVRFHAYNAKSRLLCVTVTFLTLHHR